MMMMMMMMMMINFISVLLLNITHNLCHGLTTDLQHFTLRYLHNDTDAPWIYIADSWPHRRAAPPMHVAVPNLTYTTFCTALLNTKCVHKAGRNLSLSIHVSLNFKNFFQALKEG